MINFLKNIFLFAVSVFFAFAVAEVGVRVLSKDEVVRPIHGTSKEDRINFVPYFERTYKTSEYEYVFRSNSFGRRDIEWTDEMISSPENIIFIGDSFVYGYGVQDDFSMPTLMESFYKAVDGVEHQVFNFGMPGPVSIPEYKLLLDKALELGIAADTVVVAIFVGNDFQPGSVVKKAVTTDVVATGEDKPFRSELFELIKNRIKNSPRLSGLVFRIGGILGLQVYQSPAAYIYLRNQTPAQINYFESILQGVAEIRNTALEHGRKFVLVIIPNKTQVESMDELTSSIYDAEKPNRRIMEYCAENGVVCLDLLPPLYSVYKNGSEPLYYPIDRHFTEYGNEVASKLIFEFLHILQTTNSAEPGVAKGSNTKNH